MKLGLINSTWFGSPVGTAEGIGKTKEIGFDTIDIFADPLEIDVRERRLIRDTCSEVGLPVISIVCCALGMADFNSPVRRYHIDRAKRHLDFAYELEARNLVLVLGEYIWQQEVIKPQDQWNWAVESTREVGDHAAELGMEIAIELEPFYASIVNTVAKMSEFLRDVDHPAVRANLDVSHLVLSHSSPEDVSELRGRIAHVHLSDCDGNKHGDLPPGRGTVNFKPFLEQLRDAGYKGVISIELEYAPEAEIIEDWVKEAYRETDKLMQEVGVRDTA
jgi:D-psicose/D-tagatose/L-ribulose 3-epimerase